MQWPNLYVQRLSLSMQEGPSCGGGRVLHFWYLLSFIPDSQIQPGSYNPMTRACKTHEREKHTRRSYRETTDFKHYRCWASARVSPSCSIR